MNFVLYIKGSHHVWLDVEDKFAYCIFIPKSSNIYLKYQGFSVCPRSSDKREYVGKIVYTIRIIDIYGYDFLLINICLENSHIFNERKFLH